MGCATAIVFLGFAMKRLEASLPDVANAYFLALILELGSAALTVGGFAMLAVLLLVLGHRLWSWRTSSASADVSREGEHPVVTRRKMQLALSLAAASVALVIALAFVGREGLDDEPATPVPQVVRIASFIAKIAAFAFGAWGFALRERLKGRAS